MQRRAFITLLGGAGVGWLLTAHAQQPAMALVGLLSAFQLDDRLISAVREGLKDAGYVEGRNVAIKYRAAGADPVGLGLVSSLNRPGGNVTGVTFFINSLGAKRFELLHQLIPGATVVGFLINPQNPSSTPQISDVQAAAHSLGIELRVLNASSEREMDAAFGSAAQQHVNAVVVGADSRSTSRAGGALCIACNLLFARVCRRWRADQLRREHYRCVSPRRALRGADSKRRETGRLAHPTDGEIRASD
jgi:putative ABC transport system substrate-binding protein